MALQLAGLQEHEKVLVRDLGEEKVVVDEEEGGRLSLHQHFQWLHQPLTQWGLPILLR